MWIHKRDVTFSQKLKLNFWVSTLLPFVVISVLISAFYNWMYDRNIRSLTSNYINAIVRNIDVYFDELEQLTLSPYYSQDVIDYLSQLHRTDSMDFAERNSADGRIQNLLSFMRFSREDVQSMVLVNNNNCMYYTTDMLDVTVTANYPYSEQSWYQQSVAAQGEAIFIPKHTQLYFDPTPTEQVFGLARAIVDIYTRETLAVVKIDANNQVLDLILNDTVFSVSGNVYLTDTDGNVIYAKEGAMLLPKLLYPSLTQTDITTFDSDEYLQMVKPLQNGWALHVLLDQRELRQNTVVIFIVAGTLYLLGTLLSFYFYQRSSTRLISVIDGIKNTLLSFEQGDFTVRCTGNQVYEFQVLCDSINHMILELDKKIHQEYISTIRLKDAELKALKSQIEPHFLFNTLNSMIALSQEPNESDIQLLEKSLFSLSYLLRYVLNKQEEVELADELKILESYCNLQALRFDDRFSYSFVNNTNGHWGIPRLALQPFVENAIIHGIEPVDRRCSLSVHADYDVASDLLQITICDDGNGSDEDISTSRGIGVSNSLERFRIYYPDTQVQIVSSKGAGCLVRISIPHPIAIHLAQLQEVLL